MYRSKGNWTARRAHKQWTPGEEYFIWGVDEMRTVVGWWSYCK